MYTFAVCLDRVAKLDLINEVILIEYKQNGRRLFFHTDCGCKKNITSLRDMYSVLKSVDYVRSENYLINTRHVVGIRGNTAIMSNGMEVYLTRQGKKELKAFLRKA